MCTLQYMREETLYFNAKSIASSFYSSKIKQDVATNKRYCTIFLTLLVFFFFHFEIVHLCA